MERGGKAVASSLDLFPEEGGLDSEYRDQRRAELAEEWGKTSGGGAGFGGTACHYVPHANGPEDEDGGGGAGGWPVQLSRFLAWMIPCTP